ncbi:MAG: helical backbone metal receptor [Spirochaetia bacterium]|jgi:iron complex transport system substrate-binding protein|nr:helical backbone metal receptor [Spirochaetia bacterium]
MKTLFLRNSLLFLFAITCCKPESDTIPSGIVSLSPSITKEIIDLGAEELLAGVTSYHPPLSRKVEIIGSITVPNFEKILLLKPDIVLFSEEDGSTQPLKPLEASGLRLHKFGRNKNFSDICANYIELGKIIGKESEARSKAALYASALSAAKRGGRGVSVLVLISHEPLITASGLSFIGQMITDAGGKNIFDDAGIPYPIVSAEAIVHRDPDAVIIMSEGGTESFSKSFSRFSMRALKNGALFKIEPEHIAYYTPADYADAVKDFTLIFDSLKPKQ